MSIFKEVANNISANVLKPVLINPEAAALNLDRMNTIDRIIG